MMLYLKQSTPLPHRGMLNLKQLLIQELHLQEETLPMVGNSMLQAHLIMVGRYLLKVGKQAQHSF